MNMVSLEVPSGWRWVTDPQERRSLEQELAREMSPKHLLFGRSTQLLARHEGRDEFLFRVGQNEVAQVHLTWRVETDPFWPNAELHPSLEAWAATGGIMS